ncbi:S8 family serine peptidase [Rhodocaloribacter litoris]|uniref:S8 family peptidase n=1 Tax=Rhodocaloribacter litoris TaxID=2558931 RepID=UPI001421D3B9|nr:S8 family serine peptidase [Rhodocaloribacter litoris]QXD15029.1 S8 family serine peptidase [Rhodocaloribacter litoris]GIV62176.1 MAG: peptidase S8 [Rhodothermaceae bacterium]
MNPSIRLLPALLLALFLSACAATRPDATAPPATAPATEASGGEEPAPAPVPETTPARPNDWFHRSEADGGYPGIGVEQAYATLLKDRKPARTVVVAVIDSGIDIEHEDLKPNIWVNEDEVPGNGKDDDGNGYVDDLHGWNFIGGPDGRHVHYDTYELTREYARLLPKYEGKTPADVPETAQEEYAYFRKLEAEYEEKVAEARQQLANIGGFLPAAEQATRLLQEHFGKEEITAEDLETIEDGQTELGTAKQILRFMRANEITLKDIRDYVEHLQADLDYRLKLDFDPRPIVGDNYADPTERFYGNGDVVGPDPEHGTHVAGIIGAVRGNGLGLDGIADAVRIMVLRAVPDGDERDKDVANAIRYAVDNGAHIINMSFGKAYSPQKAVVDEAVRYAEARGVLLVHAAGNSGENVDETDNFPNRTYAEGGAASNWIEVGASSWKVDETFVASFSNYGRGSVDLFAPGVAIYSTLPGNAYGTRQGTSMAAPVVSGTAALLMAYFPSLTATEVADLLRRTVTPYAGREVVVPGTDGQRADFATLSATGGVVNAYAALKAAAAMAR